MKRSFCLVSEMLLASAACAADVVSSASSSRISLDSASCAMVSTVIPVGADDAPVKIAYSGRNWSAGGVSYPVSITDNGEPLAVLSGEGVWEQSGYARPAITESFDPERTRVDVEIEVSEKSTEKRGEYTGKSTERNVALTETEEKIVAILVSNGYATQKSISAKLGITRTYVTKIMGELQSKGVICRVGPDKGGHWEVVKKGRMS